MRTAFTLVEILVVTAITALLAAILLPALAAAREAGRVSVCQSNLRQAFLACRMYADANRGFGPAIGEPYFSLPNWGLVVQRYYTSGGQGTGLFNPRSVLVCPTIRAYYSAPMNRTYAMNTTGHAGIDDDPGSYDDPDQSAHIHFDRVRDTSRTPVLLDSARVVPPTGIAPPSVRTASMIDFRQLAHVEERLHPFHRREDSFNVAFFDGSSSEHRQVRSHWQQPLP